MSRGWRYSKISIYSDHDANVLLFTIICLVSLVTICHCYNGICPTPNATDELHFRKPIARESYTNSERTKVLTCCTTGYTSLIWYKYFNSSSRWQQYPWLGTCTNCRPPLKLENQNQSLILDKPTHPVDSGQYRCVAVKPNVNGAEKSIETKILLHIILCDELPRGSLPIRVPSNKTVSKGESVSFKCSGYFGCGSTQLKRVHWNRLRVKDGMLLPDNLARVPGYSVREFSVDNGTIIGATLTIKRVDESHYNELLYCDLITPQVVQGNWRLAVSVHRPKTFVWIRVVSAVTIIVVILLALSSAVYMLYWPQISLFLRHRWCCKLSRPDQYTYDAIVVGSEEDNHKTFLSNEMMHALNDYKLHKGFIQLVPGRTDCNAYMEAIRASYAVLILVSPETLKSECLMVIKYAFAESRNIVLLGLEEIKNEQWKEYKGHFREEHDLKYGQRILAKYKWPGNEASSRRKNKFWCQVKSYLPVPKLTENGDEIPIPKSTENGYGYRKIALADVELQQE